MKKFFAIMTVTLTITAFSYGQKTNKILEEGILLYRLEKAAWYGTDFFLGNFPHKKDFAGGYVSYLNERNQIVSAFFEKENPLRILARLEFESFPQENPIRIDTLNQVATSIEVELITLKQNAIQRLNQNEDGFFTFYENTSFNFIPLIQGKQRRVFILTAPTIPDVVLIGNDYLLTYNNKNRFVGKEKIHNSILQFSAKSGDPENKITSTHHTHVLSPLITSTDICTLLLNRDFVEWETHYVISEKYVSCFNLETTNLSVITKKEWDKIHELQKNNK